MSAVSFHADIRAAIRQHVLLLPNLPQLAWEGKDFTPVKGQPWARESLMPVSSVVTATGRGGVIAHTVNATFQLHYPPNEGTTALDSFAGALLEHFRPGTALTYAGSSAVIQQAQRMGLAQETDWINCPVIITAIGHTSN